MARDIEVGLRIGAVVSGSLRAAFGSVRGTVQQLGRATDGLTAKQRQIGTALSAAVASGGSGLARLRAQYDRVGRTIDQLKIKQDRLNASIARGETLASQRQSLRGQAMETVGTAVALGAPVFKSLQVSTAFKDQTNDISITGGFDEAEEKRLGDVLRGAAVRWNQVQSDVAAGAQVLIAGGIENVQELSAYAPVMAKAATATRASMDDLGAVAIALGQNLNIGAEGYERALNMLAFAGKKGQFELADMAKWLPQLTPQFAALGITGERAVAEIGASLQIARRGAGSNDEAANNFKNFLSKITAPETLKSFADAGINLQSSMRNLVSSGMTPVQSMLEIITQYVGSKGPAAAKEFQSAMQIKDETERQAALDRLNEAYKLGELFADMQVLSFVRPAMANRDDLAGIQQGSVEAADKGVLDDDFARRMKSPKEQLKALTVNFAEIGLVLGEALLPPLVELSQAVLPVVRSFGAWAAENPELLKGVVGLVGGLLATKLAFVGVKYGLNLILSPINAVRTGVLTLSAKWTLLKALFQMGSFGPVISGLRAIGSGLASVARLALLLGRGLSTVLGGGLSLLARGGVLLGRVLGGALVSGLKLAGQAALWLGRALMLNPIGLLITAIAGGAYLIYRNWNTIGPWFQSLWSNVQGLFSSAWTRITSGLSSAWGSITGMAETAWGGLTGFFSGLWGEVQTAVDGGIRGVGQLLLNWSPVGLIYRAIAGGLSQLGIELPAKFSEFGSNLMSGLIGGISNMGAAVRDSIVGMGDSVAGWFKEKLGINSPSRVFIGFGENVSEGAALGIQSQVPLAGAAAKALAGVVAAGGMLAPFSVPAVSFAEPALAAPRPVVSTVAQPSPLIPETLTAAAPGVSPTVGSLNLMPGLAPLPPIPDATQSVARVLQPLDGDMPGTAQMRVQPVLDGVLPAISSALVRIVPGLAPLPPIPSATQSVARVLQPLDGDMPGTAQVRVPPAPDSEPPARPRFPPAQAMQTWRETTQQPTAPAPAISFAPVIHVDAAAGPVKPQVEQAMRMSFDEFTRLMERYNHQVRRRSYGDE